jgi:hypothetical protein
MNKDQLEGEVKDAAGRVERPAANGLETKRKRSIAMRKTSEEGRLTRRRTAIPSLTRLKQKLKEKLRRRFARGAW